MIVLKDFGIMVILVFRDYIVYAFFFAILVFYIRHRNGKENSWGLFFLYIYTFLVYGATVLSRIREAAVFTTDLLGIRQLFENPWYLVAFVENIIMFIPFGILYAFAFYHMNYDSKWKCTTVAVAVSCSIECLQGIFHLGEAQLLDVASNVLGAWIGWKILLQYRVYREKRSQRISDLEKAEKGTKRGKRK